MSLAMREVPKGRKANPVANAATREISNGEPESVPNGELESLPNGELESVLGRVRLAPRQAGKDVTLWPLVLDGAEPGARAELWPLDEAMEDGFVSVVPPDSGGRVHLRSRAPMPVWVPSGELLGAAGRSACSAVLAPHGGSWIGVAADAAGRACPRCRGELAAAFRAVDGQVGFLAAIQDRACLLELVLPAGPLARRLRRRLEAWAPFLLAPPPEGDESPGLDSPEALLAVARRLAAGTEGPDSLQGARMSLVLAGPFGGGCIEM